MPRRSLATPTIEGVPALPARPSSKERSEMANHLTPEELSKELGIDRQEVIKVCVQEGVPIYQGKIDKTLFQAQLQAIGAPPQGH
jgi:hypothetical protein